jgi:hypothetical protein
MPWAFNMSTPTMARLSTKKDWQDVFIKRGRQRCLIEMALAFGERHGATVAIMTDRQQNVQWRSQARCHTGREDAAPLYETGRGGRDETGGLMVGAAEAR